MPAHESFRPDEAYGTPIRQPRAFSAHRLISPGELRAMDDTWTTIIAYDCARGYNANSLASRLIRT